MSKSSKELRLIGMGVALLVLMAISHRQVSRLYQTPYPPYHELNTRYTGFQDLAFVAFGFRDLAADIAWIQLIQYMGGGNILDAKHSSDYKLVKYMTLRVTKLDPFFHRAYLNGATLLAFFKVLNRPEEGLEILAEGIKHNPEHWAFHKMAAGIGYKMKNQTGKMLEMLEATATNAESPVMLRVILANSFQEQKQYKKAFGLWESILTDENGRDYHERAKRKIFEIGKILRIAGRN